LLEIYYILSLNFHLRNFHKYGRTVYFFSPKIFQFFAAVFAEHPVACRQSSCYECHLAIVCKFWASNSDFALETDSAQICPALCNKSWDMSKWDLRMYTFLGAFAKFRKASNTFAMSVRLPVRMEQPTPAEMYWEIRNFYYFSKVKIVSQTRLNVNFISKLSVLFTLHFNHTSWLNVTELRVFPTMYIFVLDIILTVQS
jgi:hypothetical protein